MSCATKSGRKPKRLDVARLQTTYQRSAKSAAKNTDKKIKGPMRARKRHLKVAERVGFEPTCRLPDKTLSRRPRYDHFGTSPFDVVSKFNL